MANQTTSRQTYTFRDAKGQVARCSVFIRWDSAAAQGAETVAATLGNAIAAATNANWEGASGPYSFVSVPALGTAATYVDIEDKAVLSYLSGTGQLHRLSIPAPKATLFYADQQTVEKADTLVAAITAAMILVSGTAYVSDRGGTAYIATPFVGGQRKRVRTQRRMSIYTQAANLDEPAE